ncbi:MAG: hypothetical protein BM562_04335 [Alphaproteobacteria bacterium MedPE-SWcel]|nr:MAG: hypothetical protein BM562_04335 [Alphaproteobacteria bacterium MedPE-SWcel]
MRQRLFPSDAAVPPGFSDPERTGHLFEMTPQMGVWRPDVSLGPLAMACAGPAMAPLSAPSVAVLSAGSTGFLCRIASGNRASRWRWV